MAFGKRFNAYMKKYPNAAVPSANRCSQLPYNELRTMAKTMYYDNRDSKIQLYRYQNMTKTNLANAVYHAMGTLK